MPSQHHAAPRGAAWPWLVACTQQAHLMCALLHAPPSEAGLPPGERGIEIDQRCHFTAIESTMAIVAGKVCARGVSCSLRRYLFAVSTMPVH